MKDDRVDFNITNNGISVGANVTRAYFEERVLPLITTLLLDMAPSQTRRGSSRRTAKSVPREMQRDFPMDKKIEPPPVAEIGSAATRVVAISSYSNKPLSGPSSTKILA